MNKKNISILLTAIIIFAAILRFYNLNWGTPFYFHPDERNIASSVSQLNFPGQMNPHFFAYGSLPIYSIYFTGIAANYITQLFVAQKIVITESILNVSFSQAIIISRYFSALFSLLLIPLLFYIGKKIKNNTAGLIAAFFTAVSTGLIQFSHYGTFEMWLTILSILLFLFTIKLLQKDNLLFLILTALIFGCSVATKVSHIVLLPLPFIALGFTAFFHNKKEKYLNRLLIFIRQITLFCLISIMVFVITNPFVFSDFSGFFGSMNYESGVALGTLSVFYTGEFKNAIPVVFQFLYIYPFLINPFLTVLLIPAIIYFLLISVIKKKPSYLFLIFYFLFLFLSQAFLYVKWTRYIVPTLPFIYLIIAMCLSHLWQLRPKVSAGIFIIGWVISYIFGISYFITAFVHMDTREIAVNWAQGNIPSKARILSEVYDMGITAFNNSFSNIKLFNFYDLDNNSTESSPDSLSRQLALSDYIILPSQRILKIRLNDSKNFPNGYNFYSALFTDMTKFRKIYETPCDFFCHITYLNNPVFSFEETANVFDRPTLYIFKKNNL